LRGCKKFETVWIYGKAQMKRNKKRLTTPGQIAILSEIFSTLFLSLIILYD